MEKYVVYTNNADCKFCKLLKEQLLYADVPFDYNVITDENKWNDIKLNLEQISGRDIKTVPQVVLINEKGVVEYIGGQEDTYTDLLVRGFI